MTLEGLTFETSQNEKTSETASIKLTIPTLQDENTARATKSVESANRHAEQAALRKTLHQHSSHTVDETNFDLAEFAR